MKRPPKYKGGGETPVKVNPADYKDKLSKAPFAFTSDPGAVNPDILGMHGFKVVSGSEKSGDLVARKGSNYFLLTQRDGLSGLVDIGNIDKPVSASASTPKSTPTVIDPMKVPGYNGMLPPIVQSFKKGGKVKYNTGGSVLDKKATGAGVNVAGIGGAAATVGELGSQLINDDPNEQGIVDENKSAWSNSLSHAGKGAATGAAIGSIIPGVGTVIGAGVGALAGGIGGFIGGKNQAETSNKEIEKKLAEEEKAKRDAHLRSQLDKQFLARGFAKGGEVVGKGTGTSDSVKAKVEPGSFIVPAKITEALKETIVRKAPKRAKLNQKGGADVRLSDGELILTPEDKNKLIAAGLDVNALAPESQSGQGFAKGGEIPPAKKAELYDAIYGKSDIPADQKVKLYDAVFGPLPAKYHPKIEEDGKVKVVEITKKDAARLFDEDSARAYDEVVKTAKSPEGQQKFIIDPKNVPSASEIAAAQKKSAPKVPKKTVPQETPETLNPVQASLPEPAEREIATSVTPVNTVANTSASTTSVAGTPGTASSTQPQGSGFNREGITQALNYALPALQLHLGNKMLKDAGNRPVDQIDPDYLNAIQTAKESVARATAEARFGYTPEEKHAIDQSNTGAYRDQRFAAQNFSGGSNANAYAMDRVAANDYWRRGLESKIKDRQLRLQKQEIADSKQSYMDGLVAHKASMSRALFGDKLNAWNQNQQAGSHLLGAGVSNLMGANRFSQELAYNKERDAKYGTNPYTSK